MIIRLGYVSITNTLDNITSSHNISYTNYFKSENKYELLDNLIIKNLESLNEIIKYNNKNNIHFYRITSNLIPLATIKNINIDYDKYDNLFKIINSNIIKNNIRVDMHPDQFTVLNSTKKDVIENTISILNYHYNILKKLKIKNKLLILHIGSNVFGKEKSIQRFINSFNKLPDYLKNIISVENDDKVFNIKDTLELCIKINRPMVLDYHHHNCNNNNLDINNYYELIFSTWKGMNPKIHFSSPKGKLKKNIRAHHEYINSDEFISFIESIKHLNYDIDIMLEAKAKDEALFKLIRELKYKTNYKFIDDTSFEV